MTAVEVAQQMFDALENVDFPNVRNAKFMSEWISVKESLPKEGEIVKVKIHILFKSEKYAMYIKKYFVNEGENITPWVTHWMPVLSAPMHHITFEEFKKEWPNADEGST